MLFLTCLTLNTAPLPCACSPWDQSGWRCERGRCRCSRSRQREKLHHPSRTSRTSRASRARLTHGDQMHVASVGAAAVAAPGRSSRRTRWSWRSTADITAHRKSQPEKLCLSSRLRLVSICSRYFCMSSVDSCPAATFLHGIQLVICRKCEPLKYLCIHNLSAISI